MPWAEVPAQSLAPRPMRWPVPLCLSLHLYKVLVMHTLNEESHVGEGNGGRSFSECTPESPFACAKSCEQFLTHSGLQAQHL